MIYRIIKKIKTTKKLSFKKNLNIILNTIEKKLKRKNLFSFPLRVDIVPTKLCNLRCIFCIQYSSEKKELSLENFRFLADMLFPRIYQVFFCSGGEPFLNPNFIDFLRICKERKVFINIVSNGMLLSERICKELIGNDFLRTFSFSFDAFKKETLESIRRGADYNKIVENMKTMTSLKKFYRKNLPLINIRYAVMKRNIEELSSLIEFASKIGIDRVTVNYLNVANDIDKNESLFYHRNLLEKIFKEAKTVAENMHIQLELPPLVSDKPLDSKCDYPWRFIKIDPDGSVRFCYKAWNNPVGNIFDIKNFFEIWNNYHYQRLRRSVNTNKPYFKYCSVCDERKGFSYENNHIQYLKRELYAFE